MAASATTASPITKSDSSENADDKNNKNKNENSLKLPTPIELGIIPENYAYCYCEENVRRAIVKMLGKIALLNTNSHVDESTGAVTTRKIEPFAVFCSSYNQPEPAVIFPGSWLPYSQVTLVVDSKSKATINWDYHVFVGIKITLTTSKQGGDDCAKTVRTLHYIADYDSGLCHNQSSKGTVQRLVPLKDYCDTTFSKIQKSAARLRVVPGMEYWDQFRSTRAHMLPPPVLKNWLRDKSRRNAPAPSEMLMQKPHPTDGATCGDDAGVDLAHFINMAPNLKIAPGQVLTVDEFAAGNW